MRIFVDGIVFSGQQVGGVSRIFAEVLPLIAALDQEAYFVLYFRGKLKAQRLPTSHHIQHLHERSLYPWRWIHGRQRTREILLQRVYDRAKPHIFHTSYFTIPRSLRTRYVVSVYDMIYELYPDFFRASDYLELIRQKRRCLEAADLIFSISRGTTDDLRTLLNIDERKCVTVYPGVSPEFQCLVDEDRKNDFRRRYGLAKPFFLYIGRRRFYKNFIQLLTAYSEFKLRTEIDLVLIGGEEQWTTEEQTLIASRALHTHIKRLSVLTDEALVLAYNTALALIYPSLYEGFGLPVLEAMACGTPVIASSRSSIPEAAGEAALYINPQDPDDILAAMETVLQSETARALTHKGRERAAQFTWGDTARRMLEGYNQLV